MKSLEASASTAEHKSPNRKIIAAIGAENAPGMGLVRAVLEGVTGEFAVRAIVRSLDTPESRLLRSQGAELLVADPRDEAALKRVLAGAHGAFYTQLSSEHPSLETKLATATALARAAKAAGLRHVVWATLEDPGQTFLEHNDVTPTFQDGRWISDGEPGKNPEHLFTDLGVPTTFLHIVWEPSVAAGKWTEDIGKHAYEILRNGHSVGSTVSLSAARLVRRLTPPPTAQPQVSAGVPLIAPPPLAAPVKARSRSVAIIGMVAAAALIGLIVKRQIQSQAVDASTEPVRAPIGSPSAPDPVPPPATARMNPEAPPPVAAPAEEPPPSEGIPEPEAGSPGVRSNAKRSSSPSKVHRRDAPRAGVAGTATLAASPPVREQAPGAKVEPLVREEKPPERESPPPPVPAPVMAFRAPASTVSAPPAPTSPPPSVLSQRKPDAPAPGFVDPKAVAAAVRGHREEANACYDRAIMEHPDLHGRLTIQAVLDPSGHVVSLLPISAINGGARLQSCLVAAFKGWMFPRPAGGVDGKITYSFSFESVNAE